MQFEANSRIAGKLRYGSSGRFILQARSGASFLADRLIGKNPSKAGRDIHDQFLRCVNMLLGGEAAPEEVQASAASIWDQIAPLPAFSSAKAGHRGLANQLQPFRCLLLCTQTSAYCACICDLSGMLALMHCAQLPQGAQD